MPLFSLKGVNFKNIVYYPDIDLSEGQVTFICSESGSGKALC